MAFTGSPAPLLFAGGGGGEEITYVYRVYEGHEPFYTGNVVQFLYDDNGEVLVRTEVRINDNTYRARTYKFESMGYFFITNPQIGENSQLRRAFHGEKAVVVGWKKTVGDPDGTFDTLISQEYREQSSLEAELINLEQMLKADGRRGGFFVLHYPGDCQVRVGGSLAQPGPYGNTWKVSTDGQFATVNCRNGGHFEDKVYPGDLIVRDGNYRKYVYNDPRTVCNTFRWMTPQWQTYGVSPQATAMCRLFSRDDYSLEAANRRLGFRDSRDFGEYNPLKHVPFLWEGEGRNSAYTPPQEWKRIPTIVEHGTIYRVGIGYSDGSALLYNETGAAFPIRWNTPFHLVPKSTLEGMSDDRPSGITYRVIRTDGGITIEWGQGGVG